MKLANKKILVTGADGFIGSHLTEALVRQGHDVRAFVLYNSFNSWGWLDHCAPDVEGKFEVFAGDIRDPHGVRTAMEGCDVVLHLAALIAIPYSYHSPDTYVDTNVKGTLNVVQAARDLGVEKVVHTSTSEVYGTARFVPITEDHPLQGQSPVLRQQDRCGPDRDVVSTRSFGTPVAIFRPFNTYGPRQSARAVIPTIITQIASGKRQIHLGAVTSDARLQLRRRHGGRLPRRARIRSLCWRGREPRQQFRDLDRRRRADCRRAHGRGHRDRDRRETRAPGEQRSGAALVR